MKEGLIMRYQPLPIQEGRAKPPTYKIMSAQEAIAKFVLENCYLGMTVSAAPASLIWEMVRQRDRIKTLVLVITSQIGMSTALIGSGLVRKIERAYNSGGIEGEDKVFRRAVEKGIPRPLEVAVSYTHLRAHETRHDLVCRLLLEKK